MQVGSDFVRTASLYGVTLRTARLEEVGTLLVVTRSVRHFFEREIYAEIESRRTSEERSTALPIFVLHTCPRFDPRPITSLRFASVLGLCLSVYTFQDVQ